MSILPSIFVLDPKASGALTISGEASINIPGAVVVDSSSSRALSVSGEASIAAASIQVVGGVHSTDDATLSPAPTTGVAPLADPLAGLPSPSAGTSLGAVNLTKGSLTIGPGTYSQIKVSGKASLTLLPGVYVITGGGFAVSGHASVSGSGVMIYNAGSSYPSPGGEFGGIALGGDGTIQLSPAATGPYAGVVIFQSRQNTRALSVNGEAMLGIGGTIYAANALLSIERRFRRSRIRWSSAR